MDFDGLLQSVVRFSNFMTSRIVVSGLFFYVVSGFTDIGSASEGVLPNLDLLNNVVDNYQNIFDILGVSEFAMLLLFFLFVTAIHLTYVAFERIRIYIPPAIMPLSGWQAIEDLTRRRLRCFAKRGGRSIPKRRTGGCLNSAESWSLSTLQMNNTIVSSWPPRTSFST